MVLLCGTVHELPSMLYKHQQSEKSTDVPSRLGIISVGQVLGSQTAEGILNAHVVISILTHGKLIASEISAATLASSPLHPRACDKAYSDVCTIKIWLRLIYKQSKLVGK